MTRRCERVRARIPELVDDTLPAWRRRLLVRHVTRCQGCTAELERQRAVAAGLRELHSSPHGPEADPPEELLDEILERLREPRLRERVAAPARGAVSGARPGLSLATVAIAGLIIYLAWRGARGAGRRRDTG